jgi:hypothetical protein
MAERQSTSGSPVRRFVIILLVGAGLIFAAFYGLRYFTEPWSVSWPGHKALVGYWQGEVTFGPGDQRQVAIHLESVAGNRPFGESGGTTYFPEADMEGEARMCGSQGNATYDISGDVENRQGARFEIGFVPQPDSPGRHPDVTQATWDGEDRLQLTTRTYTGNADGSAEGSASAGAQATPDSSGDSSGAITFELRRGDQAAFDAAC